MTQLVKTLSSFRILQNIVRILNSLPDLSTGTQNLLSGKIRVVSWSKSSYFVCFWNCVWYVGWWESEGGREIRYLDAIQSIVAKQLWSPYLRPSRSPVVRALCQHVRNSLRKWMWSVGEQLEIETYTTSIYMVNVECIEEISVSVNSWNLRKCVVSE